MNDYVPRHACDPWESSGPQESSHSREPVSQDPVEIVSNKPKLFSSTMVMASGTLVSRVLGMVRVLLVGYLLAVSTRQSDMFALATEIPTQAYLLLAGGILNAILLPQLMRARSKDADGGQGFSDRIVTLFTLLLIGLTVLLTIGTPLVMKLMSDAEWRAPGLTAQYHSLLILTALCMPQVFFFGVFFLCGQLLNARGSFGPVMWAPVANNVVQILMLGAYAVVWGFHTDNSQPFSTAQMLLLGIGSVAGVVVQALILIPYLKKVHFRFRPRFDFLHTGLGRTAHMAKWALGLVVIDQINYVVIIRLASRATAAGHGAGIASFNNAMLISMVPHGLLTVSLVTALMPSLSTLAATEQWGRFSGQLVSSIRTTYAAIVPISLLLATMGVPIATTAFSEAKGGAYVGWTLAILGVGLIPFTLRFLVNKGFNAMENTRTPFFVEIVFVAVTCVVSLVLILAVKVPTIWVAPSLAVAYTLAYIVSSALAFRLLRQVVPALASSSIGAHTVRLVTISAPGAALAGVICWLQERYLPGLIPSLIGLVVAGLVGIGVYWGLAKVIRVPEVQDLEAVIRSKLRKEKDVEPNPGAPGERVPDGAGERADLNDSETATIDRIFGSDENQPILTGLAPLVPGALIAERYRLGEMVCTIGAATRWSGVDEGLSRPVFIMAFPNDEHTMSILEAARMASGAMDARFLRILDAGQDADGAYIVSEWAEGHTLAEILGTGPLSGEESAWVVREVAAGLASIHAMGVYHTRLDPTKILVTTSGSVKISGLRVDQALTPRDTDPGLSQRDMEAMDVVGCGGLLYACLTATWPGGADVGLEQSPRNEDGLKSPIHVRPGTSVALDRLTHQILSVGDPENIGTAQGVVDALNSVLGAKDPTPSLAARASAPVPAERRAPTVAASEAVRPQTLPIGTESETVAIPDLTPGSAQQGPSEAGGAGGFHPQGVAPERPGTAIPLHHPIPPQKALLWSRVSLVLIGLVVLALITSLVVGLYNLSRREPSPAGTAPTAHAIKGAAVFDSFGDGGDGMENDEQVPLAYDGDPSTAWTTEEYGSTWIPDQKPGVGLLFDLGSPVPVSEVSFTVDLLPITITVLVPGGDPATVTTPDTRTVTDWTTLKTVSLTAANTTVQIDQTTTQYVLVYITVLAPKEDYFQADLAEVSFFG